MAEIILRAAGRDVPIRIADEDIQWAAREIAGLISKQSRVCIIADERVALLYGEIMRAELTSAGISSFILTFAPGEEHKHLRTVSKLLDELAETKVARDDVIVGLGGGVTTDIAGFVAAVYQRGVSWVAVPTSLMGMVDAAIGGKTGVDHVLGKNMIGAFHQPLAVISPVETLHSLDAREWMCGMAEVVKSALIAGGEFWDLVRARGADFRDYPDGELKQLIELSAMTKSGIVSRDEREAGERKFLNLGHTFGHAIETVTGYQTYKHGEAVFLGLRAAVKLSNIYGALTDSTAREIDDMLATATVPAAMMDPALLLDAMGRDKKTAGGKIHFVLLHEPGKCEITHAVSPSQIVETAEWLCGIAAGGKETTPSPARPKILIVNGPNLNLLGEREPEVYGNESLEHFEKVWQEQGDELGVQVLCRQGNVEGGLVEFIQHARHWADAIVINPGGYTHTSVAIRDAIKAVRLPTIEVHLSDISNREEFRRRSLISDVCVDTIMGQGSEGYGEAIRRLVGRIRA